MKASGDGPTVLTVILFCGKDIRSLSIRHRTASSTAAMFLPASPIPMKTTLVIGGNFSRIPMLWARMT